MLKLLRRLADVGLHAGGTSVEPGRVWSHTVALARTVSRARRVRQTSYKAPN